MTDRISITAGFIPLLDAAMLVVAKEKGFAEEEGVDLNLVRETSWANIRDRIAIGHFDAAHMLAPLAIAGTLGLGRLPVKTVAPMALGKGRNGITVSQRLWERMAEEGADGSLAAAPAGSALAKVCRSVPAGCRPVFAVVHPFSAHAYLLRYWLAEAGLVPGHDVDIDVVPPPFMPDAMVSGRIDGCCVGEPWNSMVMERGAGRLVTISDAIWYGGPDKVLGFRTDWAEQNGESVSRLIRALYRAGAWCDQPENRSELASILAQAPYLDTRADLLLPGLGAVTLPSELIPEIAMTGEEPVGFVKGHGAFPWLSQCLWFVSQMVRTGQVTLDDSVIAQARSTYRPDLFRDALRTMGADLPLSDSRVEGGPANGDFFDGRVFDPSDIESYLEDLPVAGG